MGAKKPSGEPLWQNTIRRFFDVLFHELTGLIALNFVFMLTILPVVTLGPALAALAKVSCALPGGECNHPLRAYWAHFRAGFLSNLLCGLALLATLALLVFSLIFYSQKTATEPLFIPLVSLSLLGLLALIGVSIHWLPELGVGVESPWTLLKGAARRTLVHLPGTLAATVLMLAILAVQVLQFPVAVPITLLFGCSLPALVGGFAHQEGGE